MKRSIRLPVLCLLAPFWMAVAAASAQESRPEQQTLSPYFLVEDADPSVDQLPLKDTRVDVAVVGVIADVTVRQVYENHGSRPIHARYVFPASTRAAVHAMSMTIRDKRIVAKVEERELLVPTAGVYEFVYPTVVGPRYSSKTKAEASDADRFVENPYTHQGEPPRSELHLSARLSTGVPIHDFRCPSHQIVP